MSGGMSGEDIDAELLRLSSSFFKNDRPPHPKVAELLAREAEQASEVNRLRARTHEIQERADRRLAAYEKRGVEFDRWIAAARDWFERNRGDSSVIGFGSTALIGLIAERDVLQERIDKALAGHQRYLPAAVDFDCCSACNRLANGYVPYEDCPVRAALTGPGDAE